MRRRLISIFSLLILSLAGCESNIVPLRPVQRIEQWEPETATATDPSATEPATTAPATQVALDTQPSTAPATQPGRMIVKIVDPNQTAKFIYKASYDNIWQQSMTLLHKTGFVLDRKDYRLGVLTTQALPSAQVVEFWKPQHANWKDAAENTVNSQRRMVRLTISKVPGKPDFYEIAIQVLVERLSNPSEEIGGPLFVEGSGFGRNAITLRSDYATAKTGPVLWSVIGHDPDLEQKLLTNLFGRL